MNDEMKALATRAVACKHWRWMPGMRRVDGVIRSRKDIYNRTHPQRIVNVREFPVLDDGLPCVAYIDFSVVMQGRPDLTDAATRLLALVRDAWGADVVVGWYFADAETRAEKIWFVDDPDDDSLANGLPYILSDSEGPTRAHALVRALELSQ